MRRVVISIILLATACSTASGGGDPHAVSTVYPLTWLVTEIAPDLRVDALAASGQDAHDFELTPSQRASVERAALVVYLGDIGYQPQVEQAIRSAQGAVVSATDVIGSERLRRTPDGAVDPHVWFDPSLLVDVATEIGTAAAQANPENAEQYVANAERTARELTALADEVRTTLSDCKRDQVVVGHEAFAYLLEPYDLQQRGISGAGGRSEASPQDIARLAARVRDLGLPAVLSEPVEGRPDAEAVASEAGVEVIDIYSLDIVDEARAEQGYPALLLEQAEAVAAAAECGS